MKTICYQFSENNSKLNMELYITEISITNSKEGNLTPKSNLFVSNLSRTSKKRKYIFNIIMTYPEIKYFLFKIIELYVYIMILVYNKLSQLYNIVSFICEIYLSSIYMMVVTNSTIRIKSKEEEHVTSLLQNLKWR